MFSKPKVKFNFFLKTKKLGFKENMIITSLEDIPLKKMNKLCVYLVDFEVAPDLQKNCKVVFKERH